MQDNKNIIPRNEYHIPHGYCEIYHRINNKLWYKCFYVNWNMYGYNEAYYRTGKLTHKIYYAR